MIRTITFFGNDYFSLPSLQKLSQKYATTLITIPNSPPSKHASKNNIKTIFPPPSLSNFNPPESDLAVIVSFGMYLPQNLISVFKYGAINLHPSLLPRYKGAAPIQHQILKNDLHSGVSIINVSEKFDSGDILNQKNVLLNPNPDFSATRDLLGGIGADLLLETVSNFEHLKKMKQEQIGKSTFARKIPKEMSMINWDSNAIDIHRVYRAVSDGNPMFTWFRGKRVQLFELDVYKCDFEAGVGEILHSRGDGFLLIKCGVGVLSCKYLKVQDKKMVKANDFVNGYDIKRGDVFNSLL